MLYTVFEYDNPFEHTSFQISAEELANALCPPQSEKDSSSENNQQNVLNPLLALPRLESAFNSLSMKDVDINPDPLMGSPSVIFSKLDPPRIPSKPVLVIASSRSHKAARAAF